MEKIKTQLKDAEHSLLLAINAGDDDLAFMLNEEIRDLKDKLKKMER